MLWIFIKSNLVIFKLIDWVFGFYLVLYLKTLYLARGLKDFLGKASYFVLKAFWFSLLHLGLCCKL